MKYFQDKESNPLLPAVLVTASDSRTPVNYVYLSIDPPAFPALPQTVWLEALRHILSEATGVETGWKISNRPDRARWMYFLSSNG